MDSTREQSAPVVRETKNSIRVDYEGKLSFKERLLSKIKSSKTWITGIVNIFRFILMLGVSFVILFPFIAKIAGSFMTKEDVIDSTISIIPKHPTLEIYKAIIIENHYFEAFLNTLLIALLCALIQTMVSCLVGYGLAKFKFKGNMLVMGLVIVTMVIPHGAMELAIKKHFTQFDILSVISWDYGGPIQWIFGKAPEISDTILPMIILSIGGLAFKNGLYIYLMRQFFKGVPDELEESAYVDGSGVVRTFFQIILPLAIPMMITVFLFSFSWQWSDEFYTNLLVDTGVNPDLFYMPDIVVPPDSLTTDYAGAALYQNVVQNTGGMMVIAPLIILYLFCQRYLVQGIERSGLVG